MHSRFEHLEAVVCWERLQTWGDVLNVTVLVPYRRFNIMPGFLDTGVS